MSLKHALLGFINYGPMTGYELKKFFDTSVAHFWNAELSQIYPTLKHMETDGLVKMSVDVQEDRPNRKVYSITEAGQSELTDWLALPAEPEQLREPLLIKIFFGAALPKHALIRVLEQVIEGHKEYQANLENGLAMIGTFAEAVGLRRDALYWELTIDAGLRVCRAELEWARTAIRTIEEIDDSTFKIQPVDWQSMNVRTATDILERLKATIPGLSTSTDNTKVNEPVA